MVLQNPVWQVSWLPNHRRPFLPPRYASGLYGLLLGYSGGTAWLLSFPSPTSLFCSIDRSAATTPAIQLSFTLYYYSAQYPALSLEILEKPKRRNPIELPRPYRSPKEIHRDKKSRHSWVKMAEDRPGAHMATLPPRIRSGVGGRLPRRPLLSYCRLFCFILAQGSPPPGQRVIPLPWPLSARKRNLITSKIGWNRKF